MSLHNQHTRLFGTATALFLVLTLFVAILPAIDNQQSIKALPNAPIPDEMVLRGKALFIANGCVGCHTQQVRNIDMDRAWGSRPSLAADYAGNLRTDFWRNTATLMGTGRTGPDLTAIGTRQPSLDWNLLHLYQPRAVVKESVMPAYPFLFDEKKKVAKNDVLVNVPAAFLSNPSVKIVATADALALVAYLQSLKQTKLPTQDEPAFLYSSEAKAGAVPQGKGSSELTGKLLYIANCASCHQNSGEGISGAFPPLKGSPIVTGKNLQLYVDIIMNGYDAREEYGAMAAVGTNMKWTEKEVAAIINYERSSWGNSGDKVTPEEVKKMMELINKSKNAK